LKKNVAIANAKRKTQLYLFISLGVVLMTIFGFLFYSNRKKVQLEKEQIKAVLLAEENERSRIARDLHDGIGQLLSAAKLNLHALENVNLVNKEIVLEKAIGLVDESAKEVRSVSHNLMPNALIKSGLVSAIKNFINQLETEQLKINIETSGLNKKINSEIELVVYRIIQECINNVIKHSKANHLFINLSINKNLLNIMIEDNGYGFDVDEILRKDGIGIKNMQARVAFLKGTMEIDSKLNKGTLFSFHVPLNIEKS
jgi:two-component system NarL family sensor kinase